jgi:hypothetical protein
MPMYFVLQEQNNRIKTEIINEELSKTQRILVLIVVILVKILIFGAAGVAQVIECLP